MANPIVATRDYVKHSVAELKKVSWPSKETTLRWSVLVITASAILAGFFATLDFGFQQGVNVLFSRTPVPVESAPTAPVVPDLEATGVETSDGSQSVEVQSEPVPADATINLPPINITN